MFDAVHSVCYKINITIKQAGHAALVDLGTVNLK
jgi:hypothetical protein